jgi:hypothetical protein
MHILSKRSDRSYELTGAPALAALAQHLIDRGCTYRPGGPLSLASNVWVNGSSPSERTTVVHFGSTGLVPVLGPDSAVLEPLTAMDGGTA